MNDSVIKLKPYIKNYLWGGEKLKDYGKQADDIIAEAWEVSTHQDGISLVDSGENKGMILDEFVKQNPSLFNDQNDLPILIKYIDAKRDLSIQVHPDDSYALKHENQKGKTEVWYVVEADQNAFIYLGLKEKVTKEEIKERIKQGTITEILNKIPTKAGDTFLIKPGTIHAVGAGNLILEIQEKSNVTYRVYDYNRKDKNGCLRKLDIDKAMDIIDIESNTHIYKQLTCEYFECQFYNIEKKKTLTSNNNYQVINFLSGKGKIADMDFNKGDSFIIFVSQKECVISGKCTFIVTTPKLL